MLGKMEIVYAKLDDLKPYKKNPRDNEGAVEKVAKSIKEFGFKVPMVVTKDGVIIAGHTRYKASQRLGLESVPVVYADDLTEEQTKAFRLADNRVAEEAQWNEDLLRIELDELEGMFTGFDDDELDNLFDEGVEPDLEDEPEVEFTEELGEENNYVVLFFDNSVDWLQAQTLFGLKSVHALDSREGFEKKGVGRVVNGTEFIQKMMEGEQ